PSQVTDIVSTDASRAWATPDTPATTTAYAARAEGSTSSTIRVAVKPRVMLRRIARHRYSATVLAAQSFAGRKASFQRFRPSRHSWKTVRRVKLKEVATTETAPTMASGATFR